MKRVARLVIPLVLILSLAVVLDGQALAQAGDVVVTDRLYVRHDGGSDATIQSCSDGDDQGPLAGGNRQQNEPAVAINPSDPEVIVAGANDYCTVATPSQLDAWMGFYVSLDGGQSWVNSLNPGYPEDTSAEGQASPIFGEDFASGDPIMDWDNAGHLFYGGIAFNRTEANPGGITPTNGHVIVSTWRHDPSAALGMDYVRTVIVGEGTPSAFFFGRFNDKPSLRVDDWAGSPHEGNAYVAWTLFVSAGENQILFSRSTDQGQTFSLPVKLSKDLDSAQGSDIAVAPDGTVYVFWRQFQFSPRFGHAIVYVKSTDGGQTFTDPRELGPVNPYDRRDRFDDGSTARNCGDGPFHCQSNFVFHRVVSLPQAVVDASGNVYVAWEELAPAPDDGDSYQPDGQSRVVVSRSTDGGASWSAPVLMDAQTKGHQWWPNLEYDRATETLVAVYYDSREDPAHSVNRPPGNTAEGTSSGDVLHTFVATSRDGQRWSATRVSSVGHQPNYEMFGDRDVPFHGDYLWIDANGGRVFAVWADNRDVKAGEDPREADQDGFDVLQCREPLDDGTFGPDTCPNAGGLNQNIYGAGLSLRAGGRP